MRSPLTKLATAAVVALVVVIGVTQIGSTPAFAEVVASFLNIKTASFKMTMAVQGAPTQSFDCLYAEPIRMRQTLTDGSTVVITDFEKGKIVSLVPAQKQAVVIEMQNMPESDQGQFNMFAEIRKHLQEAQDTPDESVESLGRKEIGGVKTVGYHVKRSGTDMTVWADVRTNLPVELTYSMGPATYTMTDIVFDVEIDESLLSLDIPAGYTVRTRQVDASEPREDDLVTLFRLWAEHMDGTFPPVFEQNVLSVFIGAQRAKLTEAGKEPSEDDMMQLQETITKMSRGGMFVMNLPADSDWHYAGQDVTFGDARTPIFWYRPSGSATYRVLYGDLHIEDVTPDELP